MTQMMGGAPRVAPPPPQAMPQPPVDPNAAPPAEQAAPDPQGIVAAILKLPPEVLHEVVSMLIEAVPDAADAPSAPPAPQPGTGGTTFAARSARTFGQKPGA